MDNSQEEISLPNKLRKRPILDVVKAQTKVAVRARDRDVSITSQTIYDFVVNFNEPIEFPESWCLKRVVMPRIIYDINTTNNVIYFREKLGAGAEQPVAAPITPGNYSLTSLAAAVGAAMTAVSPNALTYTGVVAATDRINVTSTTVATLSWSFNWATGVGSIPNTASELLGFARADRPLGLSPNPTDGDWPMLPSTSYSFVIKSGTLSSITQDNVVWNKTSEGNRVIHIMSRKCNEFEQGTAGAEFFRWEEVYDEPEIHHCKYMQKINSIDITICTDDAALTPLIQPDGFASLGNARFEDLELDFIFYFDGALTKKCKCNK